MTDTTLEQTATALDAGVNAQGPSPAPAAALAGTLRQISDLLGAATDEQHTESPVAGFGCSLGEQVRHVLDHARALVVGVESGAIDYDLRVRGTQIETERPAAIAESRRLAEDAAELAARPIGDECSVVLHGYDEAGGTFQTTAPSSVGREAAFVLSHTVHHCAMIGVMARSLGIAVPERFGYAPSTVAHQNSNLASKGG